MGRTNKREKRSRGSVETLPSGSRRVRVYAGIDPLTKRRHYLTETIPPGPSADREAEKARTRLLNEVDERRNPRTRATVNQLLDRYLKMLDVAPSTRRAYVGYVEKHIRPILGPLLVGRIDGEILDSFYAELRTCRDHCGGRRYTDHRTPRPHECDPRCGPHQCKPLAASSIRQVHWVLSGAFKRAVRWRWIGQSPIGQAEPPAAPKPNPRPPSADEAARVINAAWSDPDWGTLLWVAMTVGARRGELCALCWRHVDLDKALVVLEQAVASDGRGGWFITDTKTHQQRRIALDAETVAILKEHKLRWTERVSRLGLKLSADAFVFSIEPDGSKHLVPDSVSQRYRKMTARLGLDTDFHALRHYSATELITAGVDVRTVAGRLGHAGGGTTTLRVYSAWREEADQRAAGTLSARMPPRPDAPLDPVERAKSDPKSPYEVIAAKLRLDIISGSTEAGTLLPSVEQLAKAHNVAVGTAQRAVALLRTWGLVDVARGRRAVVLGNATDRPSLEAG